MTNTNISIKRAPLSDIQNVQPTDTTVVAGHPTNKPKPHELSVHRDQSLIQKSNPKTNSKIPQLRRPKNSGTIPARSSAKASASDLTAKENTGPSTLPSKPTTTRKTASKTSASASQTAAPVPPRVSAKPKTHVPSSQSLSRNNSRLGGESSRLNQSSEHAPLDPNMRRRTTNPRVSTIANSSFTSAARVSSRMSSTVSRAGIPRDELAKIQQTQEMMLRRVGKDTIEQQKNNKLLQQLIGTVSELKTSTSADGESGESRKMAAENAILHYSKQEMERELEKSRSELGTLREELEEARQEQQRLEMIQENNQSKLAHLAKLEGELGNLRVVSERMHKAEDQLKKMSDLEQRFESIRHDLDNTKLELNERTNSLRQAKRDIERSRSDLEQSRQEVRDMSRDRDEVRKLATKLERSEVEKDSQIIALTDALKSQESRVSKVAAEKIGLNAQLETSREDIQKIREELLSMTEQKKAFEKENEELQAQAREDAKHRRKLHNMIQELKGNIRVFARIRPPTEKEKEATQHDALFEYNEKGQGVVARAPNAGLVAVANPGKRYPFKFDKVFDPSTSQSGVFDEISELVQSALDGYRVCIFAYGQTGSGKTYTMLGQPGGNGSTVDKGLGMIPRAVRQVFESAKAMERDDWSFTLQACFLEIYNESVRDLLDSSSSSANVSSSSIGSGNKSGSNGSKEYRITFDSESKLCAVSDVTVVDVQNENQLQRLIERSMRNRTTAATKANDRSSRSHSVFRLRIRGRNSATGQELDGLLNLIDLAGSERLAHSKAEGERLRETRNINRSLSALGDVIAALANREKHVPFRNSKLTHLLQDSLGGDCKTLMFVNVSHAAESFGESLCSLRFAAKVNSCHVGTARRTAKIDLH